MFYSIIDIEDTLLQIYERRILMSALHWIIIALVCGVVEILTAGFWFLWLALAGLLTALFVRLGLLPGISGQIIVFSIITLALIIFTRPIVLRFVKTRDTHSNIKALIGQIAIVTSTITPREYGQVKVNGEIWTATASESLEVDSRVKILGIDGVKLVVERA